MLKRNWGVLLAIGVSLIISGALYATLQPRQPNLPQYDYGKGSAPDYYPGGSRCQPTILASIRDRREALRERERCAEQAEQHRLQSDDLVQQTRAANAAEAQAWLAEHLAWLGLYGTIGGFLTLVAAAAAAIYARDAAKAAREHLAHAKDVAVAELRAYVAKRRITMAQFKANTWRVESGFVNNGKTPATEVRRYLQVVVLPYPLVEDGLPVAPDISKVQIVGLIAPASEPKIWKDIHLPTPMMGEISVGRTCIIARVAVQYAIHTGELIFEGPSDMIAVGHDFENRPFRTVTKRDFAKQKK